MQLKPVGKDPAEAWPVAPTRGVAGANATGVDGAGVGGATATGVAFLWTGGAAVASADDAVGPP